VRPRPQDVRIKMSFGLIEGTEHAVSDSRPTVAGLGRDRVVTTHRIFLCSIACVR
jgi:hypothetical protein